MPDNKNYRILIVDNDIETLENIAQVLRKEQYTVFTANNGHDAIEMVKQAGLDLVVMDINLPGLDGIEVCRQIREEYHSNSLHIMFLTAHTEEYIEIAAFNMGANDFIQKPFRPTTFVKRVFSALQHLKKEERPKLDVVSFKEISLNKSSYVSLIRGEPLPLTKREFELLFLFLNNPDRIFTRNELLHKVWGGSINVGTRTIDVHVKNIRGKLGLDYIHTIKNIGYKFDGE